MLPFSFIGEPGSQQSILVLIITAVVIASTLQPLRDWLDRVTDKIFFQQKYDYYKVLEKTSRELNTVIQLNEIYRIVITPLIDDMHLSCVGIYLNEKAKGPFICQKIAGTKCDHLPRQLTPNSQLITYLKTTKRHLETGEFRHTYGHLYQNQILDTEKAEIQRILDEDLKATLILPLIVKTSFVGLVVLGEKLSGDQFTNRDLSLLETLASQMSTTLENIRLFEQMLNQERLATIGTLSASVAHEIRNPLASIKTFVQMLEERHNKPDFMKTFYSIVPNELNRLDRITGDLLNFAKPTAPQLEKIDLEEMLRKTATFLHNQLKRKPMEVVIDFKDLPPVWIDKQQMDQVFINLIINAMQASPPNTVLTIAGQLLEIHGGEPRVRLAFVDQGSGIKPEDMSNLFQPFFTTKTEGTGLGLATSRRIVESHGGEMSAESDYGKGATFTILLPIHPPLPSEEDEKYIPSPNPVIGL